MAEERPVLNAHGAKRLPSVEVDSYNLEIKDEDGFVGDKASRGAFHDILDKWREPSATRNARRLEIFFTRSHSAIGWLPARSAWACGSLPHGFPSTG